MLGGAGCTWMAGPGAHDAARPDRPILPQLRRFAQARPAAPAIVEPGREMDWQSLWQAAMAAAAAAARAPEPDPIGLVLGAGIDHAACLLGCLAAGRIAITLDPGLPPARRAALAAQAGLGAAFGRAADLPPGCRQLVPAAGEGGEVSAEAGATVPALISATSGSTGLPKLVVHHRRAIAFQAWGNIDLLGATAADRLLFLGGHASVAHAMHLLTALLAGGAFLACDIGSVGVSGLMAMTAAHRPTLLRAVPTLARVLPRQREAVAALGAVRAVRLVGEAVTAADVAALRSVLPAAARIVSSYSATETIPFDHELPPGQGAEGAPLPSGRLRPGGWFALQDEDGRSAAPGEAGEVVVRSRFNALGEWRADGPGRGGACVDGRMMRDPDDPEGRIYRTGDLAVLDGEGRLCLLGRRDREVKVNGTRVDLAEVEAVLRAVPGVRDAVVVPMGDATRRTLAAFVATERSVAELRAFAAARLARPSVPAVMVPVGEIPLMPAGKPDLRALLALLGEAGEGWGDRPGHAARTS